MKRADYELIATVIKRSKLSQAQKLFLTEDFALEIAKSGNFKWEAFKEACGLGGDS